MHSFLSFNNKHEKKLINSEKAQPQLQASVDLTIDRDDRRETRKKFANRTTRKTDEVVFVDLQFANYAKFFEGCITKGLSLNIKGFLANLHYSFKLVDEVIEVDKPRRVS